MFGPDENESQMITYHGPPLFYALIGLPRSGTSIISRVLHNVSNGFCIAEPLHRLGFERAKDGKPFDKIGAINVKEYGDIISEIYEAWADPFNAWQIGGVKEVDIINGDGGFTRWQELLRHDFVLPVFVERDPVMIYDAWMRSEFRDRGFGKFEATWNYLQALKPFVNHRTIQYETFTASPIDELNRVFAPGTFSGEIDLGPALGEMGPMDPRARVSNSIAPAKTAHNLPADVVSRIREYCCLGRCISGT